MPEKAKRAPKQPQTSGEDEHGPLPGKAESHVCNIAFCPIGLALSAVEPLKPAVPKVGLIAALSVVIGLLLAAGMIYVLELMDRRVRSRTDLESRLAVPSLGLLSRWTPAGGRLLPSPNSTVRNAHALPRPW